MVCGGRLSPLFWKDQGWERMHLLATSPHAICAGQFACWHPYTRGEKALCNTVFVKYLFLGVELRVFSCAKEKSEGAFFFPLSFSQSIAKLFRSRGRIFFTNL